jgi:RNA polymerase sigma-70 factor (ECF subfamily)
VQDEQDIVRRAQQYDQQAFGQLYEEHFDKIYRYIALKIGNKVEAEDMTQQVFLKALRSISGYKWRNIPFSAWLFYLRKKSKRVTMSLDESIIIPSDSDTNPQKIAEHRLNVEQLTSATRQLTPAQQEVISLRFAGEMPIAQVAATMDRSEGAVKALQHSAIVALRKILLAVEDNE